MNPVPLLNPKFATALAARRVRTSGSGHWRLDSEVRTPLRRINTDKHFPLAPATGTGRGGTLFYGAQQGDLDGAQGRRIGQRHIDTASLGYTLLGCPRSWH